MSYYERLKNKVNWREWDSLSDMEKREHAADGMFYESNVESLQKDFEVTVSVAGIDDSKKIIRIDGDLNKLTPDKLVNLGLHLDYCGVSGLDDFPYVEVDHDKIIIVGAFD